MFGKKKAPDAEALVVVEAPPAEEAPKIPPCDNARVIEEWLASKRSAHTRRAYQKDIERFLDFIGQKPLNHVTLHDAQQYQESLKGRATSQARHLAAVKSLLTFGCKWYQAFFPINVGAAIQLTQGEEELAARILPEPIMHRLLAAQWAKKTERHWQRNAVLLTLLYKTAIRRSELCGLSWRHVQSRTLPDGSETGQITVMGKRNLPRTILLIADVWEDLQQLRGDAPDDAPVFVSQQHGKKGEHVAEKRLSPDQVYRIVRQAAEEAKLGKTVSPHWFRHAHASHALDNGAPITLVRDTLGHRTLTTTSRYSHARPNASSGQYLKG